MYSTEDSQLLNGNFDQQNEWVNICVTSATECKAIENVSQFMQKFLHVFAETMYKIPIFLQFSLPRHPDTCDIKNNINLIFFSFYFFFSGAII